MGRALILLPLCADRTPLGAVVMAVSNIDGALFEELRESQGLIARVLGALRGSR